MPPEFLLFACGLFFAALGLPVVMVLGWWQWLRMLVEISTPEEKVIDIPVANEEGWK